MRTRIAAAVAALTLTACGTGGDASPPTLANEQIDTPHAVSDEAPARTVTPDTIEEWTGAIPADAMRTTSELEIVGATVTLWSATRGATVGSESSRAAASPGQELVLAEYAYAAGDALPDALSISFVTADGAHRYERTDPWLPSKRTPLLLSVPADGPARIQFILGDYMTWVDLDTGEVGANDEWAALGAALDADRSVDLALNQQQVVYLENRDDPDLAARCGTVESMASLPAVKHSNNSSSGAPAILPPTGQKFLFVNCEWGAAQIGAHWRFTNDAIRKSVTLLDSDGNAVPVHFLYDEDESANRWSGGTTVHRYPLVYLVPLDATEFTVTLDQWVTYEPTGELRHPAGADPLTRTFTLR